jgi:hypothetical protein
MVGPRDEYLFTRKGRGRASSPVRILSKRDEKWGVIDGPTHHGSVMFRREAYVKACTVVPTPLFSVIACRRTDPVAKAGNCLSVI